MLSGQKSTKTNGKGAFDFLIFSLVGFRIGICSYGDFYVSGLFYGVGRIVVACLGLLVAFQEKLVYVPMLPGLSKSYPVTPARLNLIYDDVWLQSTDGVRLHVWLSRCFPDVEAALDHLSQRTDIDTSRIVVFGRSLGGAVGAVLTQKIPSGLQDEMVPPFHMKILYAKAAGRNPQCTFVEFPRGMHMDTWLSGGDIYWTTNMQFLEEHSPDKHER